jgi:hypothetical protein
MTEGNDIICTVLLILLWQLSCEGLRWVGHVVHREEIQHFVGKPVAVSVTKHF